MLWLSGKADGHQQGEVAAQDGAGIPFREWWQPTARAVIVYLHGQGGHSGPFTAMGDDLSGRGFNVYAYDHRGFGLSREPRGDIASYDLFVEDAVHMIRHVRRRNPGLPVFLQGLSMGGHIAMRTAFRAGDLLAGVIALSPGFKLRTPPPWSMVVKTALLALFTPRRYLGPIPGSVVTTRNQEYTDGTRQDEHWVTTYTARFHLGTVRSIRRARKEVQRVKVPVLMLQAGDDFLVCPTESRRFFEAIRYPDKEFRLLDGLCHNLVAEPEMPQIAADIAAWINKHVGAKEQVQ